jgi:hypothetical protein
MAILAIVALRNAALLVLYHPFAVDVEIPLRAAERWLAGSPVYPPEAFDAPAGPDLPFLYAPLTLPLIAPFLLLPRMVVLVAGVVLSLAAAWFGLRRLGLGAGWATVALAWPPFTEGILGANVGIALFAGYVAVFWRGHAASPWTATLSPAVELDRAGGRSGIVAAVVAAIKVSHAHPWVNVLRHRPRAALIGLGLVTAVGLATLPLVGLGAWFDWAGQAGRSGDPDWEYVGAPLSRFIGRGPGLAVTAATLVAAFFVRPPLAGVLVGLLLLVGAPSLHGFGCVFLVPALLVVRREIALIAAALVATYSIFGIWIGIALVGLALLAGRRFPWLMEPARNA